MNAWVLHGIDDFRYEQVNEPELKEDEVFVEVKAVGICGSDIPRVYKTGTYSFPLIPGHEFSGVVKKTGALVDESWNGKSVGVFPLIPCRKCIPCQNKKYELCRNYSYIGSRRNGAFSEYVAVPAVNLLELPSGVSFKEAAMLEPMAVAVHAIRRVMPKESDTVIVCGLGTIGMLLLMFLMEMGIKNILAAGNKASQKATVLQLGLNEENYCDSCSENMVDWIMKHTDNAGAAVFFECVGKNETVEQSLKCMAPSGRICMVGNPYSDMVLKKDVYWKILRNQLVVTGSWNSSFTGDKDDDWHYCLKRLEQGKIAPADFISHEYDLKDIDKGFHIMRDKAEDYIKIMAVLE
jgi:L-iditol 2-dehydrogenase